MQIWVIYGILLVNECLGTLGTAVNETYFALFSVGAHVTGMTPIMSPGCTLIVEIIRDDSSGMYGVVVRRH